jgi:hypothetical protein
MTSENSFWFVRVLLAIGGWLGALFLLGFVAVGFEFVIDDALASFTAGAALCAAAALLLRAGVQSSFVPHFAFALSLAGQALMAWGLERRLEGNGLAALAIAAQQAVLFFLVSNVLHRVWTAGTAAIALAVALHDLHLGPYGPALLTAAVAWFWLKEFDVVRWVAAWRAAGHGITTAAIAAPAVALAWHPRRSLPGIGGDPASLPAEVLGGAVLFGTAVLLLRREGLPASSPAGRSALLIAAILGAAAVKVPGLAPAMVVLVLGFANAHRPLAAFGVLALLGYLSHYYYSLQATLLEKSALLAATGIALLFARLLVNRAWRRQAGNA